MAKKKLLIKRGESAGLPTLDYGELAYTRDNQKFYIGTPTGNVQLNTGLTANQQTLLEFWNGAFLESFDATVTSDGATITMSLEQTGGGDLTMVFNDGFTTLDCTPAATISLTAGSDTSPQENFIYIPQSTKVLTKATDDWPSGEHIRVAKLIVQSAATVQTDGVLFNQNWNDHAKGTDNQGHLTHMGQKIRDFGGTWFDGVAPTITITPQVGVPDDVDIATTSGRIYQMHLQTYPARDTSTGDLVHVVNDSASAWTTVTDLEDLLTDNTGASMSGKYFNLVFWGIINKTGETQIMCCNLPGGSYVKESDALNDVSGYDVFTIPAAFKNNGFLILRVTFQHSTASGGTWTSIREDDLRGTQPAIQAEGGVGAAQTEFADNNFKIFDEGDATKELQFQVSGVSASTTRTLTVPDEDGTIITNQGGTMVGQLMIDGGADEIQLLVQGNGTQNADIFVIEDSTGADLVWVESGGFLIVGANTDAASTTQFQNNYARSSASGSSIGGENMITNDTASSGTYYGIRGISRYTHTTGTTSGGVYGIYGMAQQNGNGGTITSAFGVGTQLQVLTGGTITNGYNLYASNASVSGTLSNQYGLYIASQTTGATNYGIFVQGGQSEFNDQVFIDGSGDEIQLLVQGNATQTGAVLVVEDSSGTDKISLWDTGIIAMVPDNNAGTLVSGNQTITSTASVTYSLIGGTFATSSTSGSSALAGMTPTMLAANASGTFTAVYGVANAVYGRTSGAGTVTSVYGVRYQPFASAGTITNLYGVYIDSPVGTGVTNHYGIYIESVAAGGSLNRAIYVAGGTSEFEDQVFVDGSRDVIQLTVQAHSTQTSDIFVIEDSTGSDLVWVEGDGRLIVGNNTDAPTVTLLQVDYQTSATSGTNIGNDTIASTDAAGSASMVGMRAYGKALHTSGTVTGSYGLYGISWNSGGGTVTTAQDITADSTVGSGSVITSRFGVRVKDPSGSGTVTNNYGVYINNQTKGGTLNYGLWSGTGINELNDRLYVDGSQDAVQLLVDGHSTQTNDLAVFQSNVGSDYFVVKGTGKVYVEAPPPAGNYLLGVKWTDVASASAAHYASDIAIYNTTAGTASLIAVRGIVFANNTSGTMSSGTGVIGSVYQNAAGGTLTAAYALRAQIIANNATGTITNAYGLTIDSPVATGTITNAYGINISAHSSAANNWAIFTGAGLVEFNDRLLVDGSQDIIQLKVQAHSTQTSDIFVAESSGGTDYFTIGGSGGVEVGVPTGGNKGDGTINTAGDIYKNNTAYTNPDYALEFWIKDGIIEIHKDKPGAEGYFRMSLDELGEYIKKHFRLPRMDDKPMGIFDRSDRMLEKVEELTTYILELHERIKVLEGKLEVN